MIFQDKEKPCTVHYIDLPGGQVPLTAMTVNFKRMPHSTDFGSSYVSGIGGRWRHGHVNLPADAMVESSLKRGENDSVTFNPTGKGWKTFSWSISNPNEAGARRLAALDFIRNTYCGGLPAVRGY
jgi:hypothetical protein